MYYMLIFLLFIHYCELILFILLWLLWCYGLLFILWLYWHFCCYTTKKLSCHIWHLLTDAAGNENVVSLIVTFKALLLYLVFFFNFVWVWIMAQFYGWLNNLFKKISFWKKLNLSIDSWFNKKPQIYRFKDPHF